MTSSPQVKTVTEQFWDSITETYARILVHPFIAGLSDGSLEREAFRFYVIQDALYLERFARSLSVVAARAPAVEDILMFNQHAVGALEVERSLHGSFFREFGLDEGALGRTPLAPTNLAYTSYLLAVAYNGSFLEAVGALLPCYWIYWEVGKVLVEKGSDDPLYKRWIDTYGGEAFAAVVSAVLSLTDRVAEQMSRAEVERAKAHFITTARYEWMFWDMGLKQERWPI